MKMFVMCSSVVRNLFFSMETYLGMGNNYICNVKTPVTGNQGANKTCVDQKVTKSGDSMSGNLNMGGNRIRSLRMLQMDQMQ